MRTTIALLLLLGLGGWAPAFARTAAPPPNWKQATRSLKPPTARATVGARASAAVSYPGSPYTFDSLLARRALDPARFDRYHPYLGRILARDLRLVAACDQGQMPINGLISDTPLHRYLRWRRSLNPQRFDTYHPVLGPILAEDQRLRNLTCPAPGGIVPPPIGGGGGEVGGGGIGNPGGGGGGTPGGGGGGGTPGGGGGGTPGGGGGFVPEPSAWALLAVGAIGAAGGRRLRWRG